MKNSILNDYLIVTAQSKGAELTSIRSLETGIEYLWQANPAVWPRHAPNLFPIVGKMNGKYTVEGKQYEMNQHGFARDSDFKITKSSDTTLVYELQYSNESLKVYPFKFRFYVIYEIFDNEISVKYRVENLDDKDIYFSVGAHPAFNVPLVVNESFSDYYIDFEKDETLGRFMIEDGLILEQSKPILENENRLFLTKELFLQDAIVLKNMKSKTLTMKSKKSKYFVKIKFDGFNYFGIWTKPGFDKFICLEPWQGIADTKGKKVNLENKEGIIKLTKSKTFECEHSMIFG